MVYLNLNVTRYKCILKCCGTDRLQAVDEIRYSQELPTFKLSHNAKTLSRSCEVFSQWPACEFVFDCTFSYSDLSYIFGSEGVK